MMKSKSFRSVIFFKKLQLLTLMLSAAIISGCANVKDPEAPIAENYPHTFQKHVQASKHWSIIADDLASQIQANIQDKKIAAKPIYVNLQSRHTDFTRAFNDFLITSLVKKGITVSRLKTGSTLYDYKVQTVQYNSIRSTLLPSKAKFTALAAGLVVVRNIADVLDTDGAILGAGVLADVWTANGAPQLELIITSSISNGSLYLTRTTDIYYANETDIHLYESDGRVKKINVFNDPFYQLN